MEKLFSFNKFFLLFCAIFVLEWLALQVVGYLRLTSLGKLDGERILGWSRPQKNIKSVVQIYDTKILKHESNAAMVKVLAKQTIAPINGTKPLTPNANTDPRVIKQTGQQDCAVILIYYRTNSQWLLGKVECE